MEVTIEHSFCPYCDEAIELYFRIVNTILFSTHEDDLRAGMEHLKNQTLLGHMIEAMFKAFAKALDQATVIDPRITDILSTKGSL